MPYNIILSNGDELIAGGLLDNTADTANTSLVLVGKNYKGYGLFLNQNFARLMENFAKSTAPAAPLPGQIWFNSTTKRLNVNISATKGTLDANWKGIAGLTLSASTPSTQYTGELWYDSTNGQLKIYTGTEWRLVGPLSRLATGNTGAIPDTVTDAPPAFTYVILKFFIDNVLVGIWSKEEDFASDVPGFATIRKGLNFNSTLSHKFWGTASLAENILVGSTPTAGSSFLRNDQSGTTTGSLGILNDTGLSVGLASDFNANVSGGTVNLRNLTNNRDFIFSLQRGGLQTPFLRGNNQTGLAEVYNNPTAASPSLSVATKNYVDILSGAVNGTANFFGDITPSANLTYTLGNTTNRFTNIFSESILVGNVNAANTFASISNVAQINLGADVTPTANISSNLGNPSRRFDTLHSNSASLTGNLSVGISTTIGNDLTVGGSALVTGRINVADNVSTAGNISTSAATVSVSPTTGALVVSGGVGVAGNLNVAGNVQVSGRLIALTVPPGTANTHVATTAFVANAVGTLGNMAFQNNTAVAISGGTITGAAISSLSITNLLTPLAINSGGTGLATVGAPGTVLTSNGTAASWQTVAGGSGDGVASWGLIRRNGSVSFPQNGATVNVPFLVYGKNIQSASLTGRLAGGSFSPTTVLYTATFNFVTAFSNTNYAVVCNGTQEGNGAVEPNTIQKSTSSLAISFYGGNNLDQTINMGFIITFGESGATTNAGVGFGQTWQNVTNSRVRNTNYTNTTGSPIQVNVSFLVNNGYIASLLVDNVVVGRIDTAGYEVVIPGVISAVVPPGSTYRASTDFGSIDNWAELR
jgi:hypothetical protein